MRLPGRLSAAIEVVAAITAMTFTALYNHINDTTLDFPPVPKTECAQLAAC